MQKQKSSRLVKELEYLLLYSHTFGTDKSNEISAICKKLTELGLNPDVIIQQILEKINRTEIGYEGQELVSVDFPSAQAQNSDLDDATEGIAKLLRKQGKIFKVTGDSMENFGIFDGDYLIIEDGKFADGDIVVIKIYDKIFVKKIQVQGKGVLLKSGKEGLPDFNIPNFDDIDVLGRVSFLLRKM